MAGKGPSWWEGLHGAMTEQISRRERRKGKAGGGKNKNRGEKEAEEKKE